MKMLMALTFSVLTFSSLAQARLVSSNSVSVDECSDSLYNKLATFSSLTDKVCSHGRTDFEFQGCVVTVANRMGQDSIEIAGQACAATSEISEALCAVDLYYSGGLYVRHDSLPVDGARICSRREKHPLKVCIIDQYQHKGLSGIRAAEVCLEKIDPVAKARKEAELKRIEAEKRREAKRQEEARRQEEQRQRRQASKQSSPASTPSIPSDNDNGVIVDLPNFE